MLENPSKLIKITPFEESFLKIWNEILKGLHLAQQSNEKESNFNQFLEKSFSPEIKCIVTFGLVRYESKPTYKYSSEVILPQLTYAVETLDSSMWSILQSEFLKDSIQLLREYLLLDLFRLLEKNPKNERLHFVLDSLATLAGVEEKVELKPIAIKLTKFCLENYENSPWYKKKINHARKNISINETALYSDAIISSIVT